MSSTPPRRSCGGTRKRKREDRRERNRLAAQRSRQRKKDRVAYLEAKIEEMQANNPRISLPIFMEVTEIFEEKLQERDLEIQQLQDKLKLAEEARVAVVKELDTLRFKHSIL